VVRFRAVRQEFAKLAFADIGMAKMVMLSKGHEAADDRVYYDGIS
jgi:hypothetical protein